MINNICLNGLHRVLVCSVLILFFSGCNVSIYHVRKESGDISKKDFYTVTYSTVIPDGTRAKITYLNKEGAEIVVKNVIGKWEKSDQYPSGQEMLFIVTSKLPDTKPRQQIYSAIMVDGKIFAEQSQAGKNVRFRVAYKLP